MFPIIGIAVLFAAILYTGRQVNIYFRMKKRLGKVVLSLSPTTQQKKFLNIIALVFVVLLLIITFSYVSSGVMLNTTYSVLVAVVVFSSGRFFSNVVELREEAILGKLNEIPYKAVKHYSFEGEGKRQMVKFTLTDGREFVSLIAQSDKEALKEAMEKLK